VNKKKYIPQIIALLVIVFVSNTSISAQTQVDTDTITSRFRTYVLSNNTNPDTTLGAYLDSLQPNGSWKDVVYTDKAVAKWKPLTHLNRLLAICDAYNNPSSIYYHSGTVKLQIYNAFSYWNTVKPTSSNWYNNDIAGPLVYGQSLLLLKTGDSYGFKTDTLNALADTGLNYYNVSVAIYVPIVKEAVLGSNQTLNLEISIYKACIKDSTSELQRDFDTAFANIKIIHGGGEGMKIDNSFYMHSTQLYNWGYGSEFLGGSAFLGYYAQNTAFGTTQAKVNLLIDFVLNGQQWFGQNSVCDFNATGRGFTRKGGLAIGSFRSSCLGYLISLSNNYRIAELNNYVKVLGGGNTNFQSPGNKQFWKSDFMTQHGSNFYLSVKTPSKRTVGSELLNGENLKAKYLPWGSTNIVVSGTEYQDAFPVWDWTRVPGTTTENDPSPDYSKMPASGFAGFTPTNSYAGGVSNGVYGLSADEFTFDSVSARKAYFFTPTAMYCLGAGIESTKSESPILTSVNQCISSGTVTVDSAGNKYAFTGQQQAYTNLNWVYHNNVGYLFPNQGNITVANKVQTGSWYSINTSQSTTAVSKTIFSVWFNHGTKPTTGTYEYIVAPQASLRQFEGWATTNLLKKISNTPNIQAFADDSAGVYATVFYKADTILLDTSTSFSISVNNPALLLIQKQNNGYSISIADPTHTLTSISVTTSARLSGYNTTSNADSSTTIKFTLPKGDSAGATVTGSYALINTLPIHFVDINANFSNGKACIKWEVSDEDGMLEYEIEKSVDGKNFSTIGDEAASNSVNAGYVFTDNNTSAINYYRIKAISTTGVVCYSSVVKLTTYFSPPTNYSLFPNPLTNNILSIQLTNALEGKYLLSIYNLLGQKVNEQIIRHSGGSGSYAFTIYNTMASGIYTVSIMEATRKELVYHTNLTVR